MSTIDLSRQATDFKKHYAGVRMQQGRVLTDDDFNEAQTLAEEERRRTRLHAIGAYGTPDAGFLPKDLSVVGGRINFTLSQGQLYLGGLRLAMEQDETFQLQKDWLNFDPATQAPAPPPAGQSRTDLVWIETWQQPVTAVEDAELFEVALGGPDTSTRWRTMRRVHVAPGVNQDECAPAWQAVVAGFGGNLSPEMLWTTSARLSVSFTAPTLTGDLCAPPTSGGYLGAENQAIRVQMVDATHYTWGMDNAAPLYRVLLGTSNGQRVKLTLLTPPRDAVHWPLRDTVVELLAWSAALPNGERLAEQRGHLCKVAVSYNPDDQTLEIDTPVPTDFGNQWEARSDKSSFWNGDVNEAFLYLRVWVRDDTSAPAAIPIGNGTLGHTGLSVAFSGGPLRPADHWIIAARPAAPDTLMPWSLGSLAGETAHGVKRWRAPIALLRWTSSTDAGGALVTTGQLVHDCRPPFLPLTRLRGCCSVTVGDGTTSFGQFTSIQAAVLALPLSGGVVCILPGRYVESVEITDRHNISLHGCGPRSRIEAPEKEGERSSAMRISGCRDVAVENLALEGGSQAVVVVRDSTAVRLADCLIQMRDVREVASVWPAVFAHGERLEICHNIVEPMPPELPGDLQRIFHHTAEAGRAPLAEAARGGIQLGGGSAEVLVQGNLVVGGTGHGITLGHILRFDDKHPDGQEVPDIDNEDPCAPCAPTDIGTPPVDGETKVRFESAGDLYDITLRDNHICHCGANGISVVRFFSPQLEPMAIALVGVHGLRIEHNHIARCLRRDTADAPALLRLILGYGGITLALCSALEIEGNRIESNGRDWRTPVCGIYVLASDGLRIEHNQIRANGARGKAELEGAQAGWRAGIHVWMALTLGTGLGAGSTTGLSKGLQRDERTLVPQIRVHANLVEQPLGRALFLLGAGAMQISDNHLASRGAGRPTDPLATTVLVANAGLSREWTGGLVMTLAFLLWQRLFGQKLADGTDWQDLICRMSVLSAFTPALRGRLPTGKLMFQANQVSFDMADAASGIDLSSTLLLSLDDVAVSSNQFEHHANQRLVLSNVLAAGLTLRCNDNRMAETWGRALLSGLTLGMLNTSTDNQSTHCIKALGLKVVDDHNQTLAELFCPEACGDNRRLNLIGQAGQAAYRRKQA